MPVQKKSGSLLKAPHTVQKCILTIILNKYMLHYLKPINLTQGGPGSDGHEVMTILLKSEHEINSNEVVVSHSPKVDLGIMAMKW